MNMRAVTFEGCFGWLHEAAPGPLGVVLCASWDYEALAIHQSWRALADKLAEAGLPTLRFDYPGSGDSLGDSAAPGAFDAAVAAIGSAVAALKERAGVSRVALVGLRLGAVFAALAADALDIEALAMIRPTLRGKTFVAEQRALAKIIYAREGAHVVRDGEPGEIEIEGFRLAADYVGKIAAVDLAASLERPPARVLIAAEIGSDRYDGLQQRLEAAGAAVTRLDLAEISAWGPAPVPPPPPLADAERIARWLHIPGAAEPLRLVAEAGLRTASFAEQAFAFGAGGRLKGVLCCPAGRVDKEPGVVVFLNTGANCHIGSGRTSVVHARALAELGIPSLRMDSMGIGDSPWLAEGPLGAIHHIERVADVCAALDALEIAGHGEVSLVGVCSGGFLAFQAALADPRVRRILVVNPSFWTPPSPDELADPLSGVFGSTSVYLAKAIDPVIWRRISTGGVGLATIARITRELLERQRLKLLNRLAPVLSRAFGRDARQAPLIARLQKLVHRGCRIRLLLSEGDPAHEKLAAELPGGDRSRLDGLIEIVEAKGADHAFVLRRTRAEFRAELVDFLRAGEPAERMPERRRRLA